MLNNIIESCIEILNNPLFVKFANAFLPFLVSTIALSFLYRLYRNVCIFAKPDIFDDEIDDEIDDIEDEQEIIEESYYDPIEWK